MCDRSPHLYSRTRALFYYTIPVYLGIPFLIWYLSQKAGVGFIWSAFGFGALGWMIAVACRAPVGLMVRNLPTDTAMLVVCISSGPLEEIIRLILLLLTGTSLPWVISLGQGWAAVEVLYAVLNGIIIMTVLKREDEKAIEVKKFLERQGSLNISPFWGIAERIFISLFHIGATLLIAKYPVMTLIILITHSILNFGAVWLSRRSMVLAQLVICITGTVSITLGLLVFNII